MQSRVSFVGAALIAASVPDLAFAQRADENIVKSAEDAFGARIGGENIGLYSANATRGFNASQAGNVRLEGLYFDQPAFIGRTVTPRTTIRVGLSAQSYPFPAPTGIVDIGLSIPGDAAAVSFVHETRQPIGPNLEILEYKRPFGDKLSVGVGTAAFWGFSEGGAHSNNWTASSTARIRPSDRLEILPFIYYQSTTNAEASPSVFTAGAFAPPRIRRDVFYGQEWADRRQYDFSTGAVVRGNLRDNWRLQLGVFRSELTRLDSYVVFYRGVQPDGMGTLDILRYPKHSNVSYSGEARATGVFTHDDFRHTVHFSVRGRDSRRFFGGGAGVNYGPARIGIEREVAPPAAWALGVRDKDVVRQITPGVSYAFQWAGVAEFSAGLQKAFYNRDFGKENVAPTAVESTPWLYNATFAYYVTPKLAFYSGYTRGLEDFGTAPDNTLNAGEPLPAQLTEQIDGGLRYTIIPGLTFVGGLFEVTKPYFDRDTTGLYTVVGGLAHRGLELSLTGSPVQGVNIVAGAVLLRARVSGLSVERGLIGDTSPGTSPRILRLNVQYGAPSWKGFTVEANVEHEGAQMANRANTLKVPALTTLSFAARYPFAIGIGGGKEVRANARLQVTNVTNTYAWTVDGNSGRFSPNQPRTLFFRFAADY